MTYYCQETAGRKKVESDSAYRVYNDTENGQRQIFSRRQHMNGRRRFGWKPH